MSLNSVSGYGRGFLLAVAGLLCSLTAGCGDRDTIESFNPLGLVTGQPWLVVGQRSLTPEEKQQEEKEACDRQLSAFPEQVDIMNRTCRLGPQAPRYHSCDDQKVHIVYYSKRLLACPGLPPGVRTQAQGLVYRYQAESDRIEAEQEAARDATRARMGSGGNAYPMPVCWENGGMTPGVCSPGSTGFTGPSPY